MQPLIICYFFYKMTAIIDQKAYLQKYLKKSSGDKKKKKKKFVRGTGLKIIDDDIDISKLRPLDHDELDIYGEGEDAPQIAGIIDDRPEDVKKAEQYNLSKWKVISQDDGFNSNIQIEEIKKDKRVEKKENEIKFGKMYSDSEDDKINNSDPSPKRQQTKTSKKIQNNPQKSDSDVSPPRRRKASLDNNKNNYDSDLSPPRKNRIEIKSKAKARKSRWGDTEPPVNNSPFLEKHRNNSSRHRSPDSDLSPPRKHKRQSPERSKNSKHSFSSKSSTKQSENKSDSDQSPPRNKKNQSDSDQSSSRKKNKLPVRTKHKNSNYDSDESPPRKRNKSLIREKHDKKRKTNYDSDQSPPRRRKHSDSDQSPPRRRKHSDSDQSPPRRRKHSDSDQSPPRKRNKSPIKENPYKHKTNYNSDQSPPRKRYQMPERYSRNRRDDSPPPSNKKMEKTLEGKKAGLQNARQLREENDSFKRREDEAFRSLGDEILGRNANVVSRKIGKKRETSEERRKQIEKEERQRELNDKYKKWSKGVKQQEEQDARVRDFLHESSKPLARHKDDKDLEKSLKMIEREGDPMLQYMREKKREKGELGPEKPTYKGNFPPNRFNIRPGYRWDGVDRSNGYEKKYFDQQSKRRAQEEEYNRWCAEDL